MGLLDKIVKKAVDVEELLNKANEEYLKEKERREKEGG